jgi:hypothetical protein
MIEVWMMRPLNWVGTHRLHQPWLKSSHQSMSQGMSRPSCCTSSGPILAVMAPWMVMLEMKHEALMWNSRPPNRQPSLKQASRWKLTICSAPLSSSLRSSTVRRIRKPCLQLNSCWVMPEHGGQTSPSLAPLTKCGGPSSMKLSIRNISQQALCGASTESS